ncbi:MAG TPA: LruC domain-containing protein [Bacteroidales bacterium]|nr:LruC domain-containing protein [Bacteroidales bacterium]
MKKKIFSTSALTLCLHLFLNVSLFSQVILDFESGNQGIEIANCWSFVQLNYQNNSQQPGLIIEGSFSGMTHQLNNPSPDANWIKTPWIRFSSGEITFDARLNGGPGNSRNMMLAYIGYDPQSSSLEKEAEPVSFYTYSFPGQINNNTTIRNISVPVPAEIANSENAFKIRISFYGNGGSARVLVDNLVFPGDYWSDTPLCLPMALIVDTDGDGVSDEEDDYPDDPFRAYNLFNPADDFGTVAFEDLWPSCGDFDYNDLILDFKLKFVLNASGEIVEMNNQFIVRAIGAGQKNGFGFSLSGVPVASVISASGDKLTQGIISKLPNGVEANQSEAVFVVVDNAFTVLSPVGGGYTGANTSPGAPWVEPDTIFFNVVFMIEGIPGPGGAVNYYNLTANEKFFNPFIFINLNRSKELHLADYEPTDLADASFFGTYDDDTTPSVGKYYKTKNNIPWAVLLTEKFDYPVEQADIIQSHLKFKNWAESNGSLFPEWFKPLQGYRDPDKIYVKP